MVYELQMPGDVKPSGVAIIRKEYTKLVDAARHLRFRVNISSSIVPVSAVKLCKCICVNYHHAQNHVHAID